MSDIFIIQDEDKNKNSQNNSIVDKTSIIVKINEYLLSKQSLKVKEKVKRSKNLIFGASFWSLIGI